MFTENDLMLMSVGSSARMKEGFNNLLSASATPMSNSGAPLSAFSAPRKLSGSNFPYTKMSKKEPIKASRETREKVIDYLLKLTKIHDPNFD